jgi:hypothetical protein
MISSDELTLKLADIKWSLSGTLKPYQRKVMNINGDWRCGQSVVHNSYAIPVFSPFTG